MRKIQNITLFIFLLFGLSYGQTATEPKLVGAFKPMYYEDIYERLDSLLIKLGNEIDAEKNSLAIRICSNTPLPVAFKLAKGMPEYVIENLKRYNPSLELNKPKVIILRNNTNCKIKKNDYFLTEYWIIANNERKLKFVESENADNLLISEIEVDKNLLFNSKQKILNTLKSNKNSWLIINISSKNKMIPKKIQKMQEFLYTNRIKTSRIFIKSILQDEEKDNFKIFLIGKKDGKTFQ